MLYLACIFMPSANVRHAFLTLRETTLEVILMRVIVEDKNGGVIQSRTSSTRQSNCTK